MSGDAPRDAVEDPAEARWEAELIDSALKVAKHRAKGLCGFIHYAWGPHEGCAEFMDAPDWFLCDNPGTTWVMAGGSQEAQVGPDWDHYCPEHAEEVRQVGDVLHRD